MNTWELGGKLSFECCRQRISDRIDMLLHDLPGFGLMAVILLLQLLNKFNMVRPKSCKQISDSVLWEVAIDPAEECSDLIGIRGVLG